MLINIGLVAIVLLVCWTVGFQQGAGGLILQAILIPVAAWTAFNGIVFGALALTRSASFSLSLQSGRLEFTSANGNLILAPDEIEKYLCYTNKIVFRHPGRAGIQFLPFLRGKPDRTTLHTVLLSGGQPLVRHHLSLFDGDWDKKQTNTFGSIVSWLG
jgi:hypothetical protein